jgi:hypothetical protein
MFVVVNNNPYYISADRHTVYPCAVSAEGVTVDFAHGAKAPAKATPFYTDTEIRARFGICYEERLDENTGAKVRVSNKTVSSIKPKAARSKNENTKSATEN